MRIGRVAAIIIAASVVSAAAATVIAAAPRNEVSDELEKLSPAARAAKLAEVVGHWCIGTDTFFMGTAKSGPEAGYAYWSLRCLEGQSYAIQFDTLGESVAVDCRTLAENGQGRECFKKF